MEITDWSSKERKSVEVNNVWDWLNVIFGRNTLARLILQIVLVFFLGTYFSNQLAMERSNKIRESEIFRQNLENRQKFFKQFQNSANTRKFLMRKIYWQLRAESQRGKCNLDRMKKQYSNYEEANINWNTNLLHRLKSLYIHFENCNKIITDCLKKDTIKNKKCSRWRRMIARILKDSSFPTKISSKSSLYVLGDQLQYKFRNAHIKLTSLLAKSYPVLYDEHNSAKGIKLKGQELNDLKLSLDKLDLYSDNYFHLLFLLSKEISTQLSA